MLSTSETDAEALHQPGMSMSEMLATCKQTALESTSPPYTDRVDRGIARFAAGACSGLQVAPLFGATRAHSTGLPQNHASNASTIEIYLFLVRGATWSSKAKRPESGEVELVPAPSRRKCELVRAPFLPRLAAAQDRVVSRHLRWRRPNANIAAGSGSELRR